MLGKPASPSVIPACFKHALECFNRGQESRIRRAGSGARSGPPPLRTTNSYRLFHHSPLEGKSVRRGRSPKPSRWGDGPARRKSDADAPDRPCKTPRPHGEQGLRNVVARALQGFATPVHTPCTGVACRGNPSVDNPPPHQPSPDGSASATPPQGLSALPASRQAGIRHRG